MLRNTYNTTSYNIFSTEDNRQPFYESGANRMVIYEEPILYRLFFELEEEFLLPEKLLFPYNSKPIICELIQHINQLEKYFLFRQFLRSNQFNLRKSLIKLSTNKSPFTETKIESKEIKEIKSETILRKIYHQLLDNFDSLSEQIISIEEMISNDNITVKYILDNQEPVGFYISETKGKVLELRFILVLKDYRNRGYGLKLLQNLFNNSTILKWQLWVDENNSRAVELYKKLGFKNDKLICEIWKL